MIRKNGRIERVRLIGVDAPEVQGPYRNAEKGGIESRNVMKELLDGKDVYLQGDPVQGAQDRYGRILAYVFRADDRLFVNEEIILRGYATAYRRFHFAHHDEFVRLEGTAQAARRGLWSSP
ncbi:MAG: thermonuclease family protein [Acidobacteriota bacterium]